MLGLQELRGIQLRWNGLLEGQRFVALVGIAFLAFFADAPAFGADSAQEPADFGLHFVDGEDVAEAPLLASLMEIHVTGIVARARVTQMFTNPSAQTIEAVYVFPIPDRGAVDQLRLRVGDRETVGVVHETAEAERIYREAESDGRVASLLSMQRSDVFTTRVTQIGPGETVEIEVGLQFTVDYQSGSFRLRFPMVVAPRFPMSGVSSASVTSASVTSARAERSDDEPGIFALPSLLLPPATRRHGNPAAFHVTLDAGFPIAELDSPSHPIEHRRDTEARWIVRLRDELTASGRDFLLTWRPQPGRLPRAEVLVDEFEGERYGLVMIIPPTVAESEGGRLPRETIFVVDTSGSMKGQSLDQAREALHLALDDFSSGDKINVIRFSDQPTALFPSSRPAG